MNGRTPLLLLAALALLLADPQVAWAAKKADGAVLVVPALAAFLIYPLGLAVHLAVLAVAPQRGGSLVARARDARRKILVLGSINTLFLVVIVAATGKPAPPISLLVLVAGLALALIGSHGVARDLGARVLGHDEPAVPGADAKEVAVGWFVMVFSAALPLVGLFLAIYWLVASVGVAAMLLLVGPPTGDAPDPTGEAPDPTGDGPAGDASPTGDAG